MNYSRLLCFACLSTSLIFVVGCFSAPLRDLEPQQRAFLDKLYIMPEKERVATIKSMDMRTQFAWYIYRCQIQHTSGSDHAIKIAAYGKEIVPLLCSTLATAKDYETMVNIVQVFKIMNENSDYPVASNVELLRFLEQNIKRFSDYQNSLAWMWYTEIQANQLISTNNFNHKPHVHRTT